MDAKHVEHIKKLELELRALRAEAQNFQTAQQQLVQHINNARQDAERVKRMLGHVVRIMGVNDAIVMPTEKVDEAERDLSTPPGYRFDISTNEEAKSVRIALVKNVPKETPAAAPLADPDEKKIDKVRAMLEDPGEPTPQATNLSLVPD